MSTDTPTRWLPGRLKGHAPGTRGVGATATEELHALLYPGKRIQWEERRIVLILRDDEHDGAPKRTGIDLDAGTARVDSPASPRLVNLVNSKDPKRVAAASGTDSQAALIYLADHVDAGRESHLPRDHRP